MGIGTDFVLWIGAMNLVTLCAVVLAVRRRLRRPMRAALTEEN